MSAHTSDVVLKEVTTSQALQSFIDLPWEIYKGDPYWVPPLKIATKDLLNPKKNPFFKHSQIKMWTAHVGSRVVGRIAAIIDEKHNAFHEEKTAFFGFFESIDDARVARTLLDAASRWGRERGMTTLRGPMNPSTNHECGLLIQGFLDPPAVMMTYNPPYYEKLFEAWGLAKSKDLYAYELTTKSSQLSERLMKHLERIKKRGSVQFRTLELRNFDAEIGRILEIYNDAWEKNWGFVPMDEEEFRHVAQDMKMILDPRLVLMAEVRGEPAGFALTLPDVNQVFHRVKDGKLFPTGLVKLLWNLKGPGRKKTITRCRIVTLGIKKKFQELGLGPLFYAEYQRLGRELGYDRGEASWILDNNIPMNRALEQMNGERYKVYRIYDKPLQSSG